MKKQPPVKHEFTEPPVQKKLITMGSKKEGTLVEITYQRKPVNSKFPIHKDYES